ncbi:hypothetical protein CGCSCA5_v002590 [Colletotrichum siamense]|nr:hypothetical protein CGCSCA5_v002590 [Colletotrichum siamense]
MLQPDPDIGGVGVIVAFIGTAWLSVILVTLRYCLAFDPKFDAFYDPERDQRDKGRRLWKPNPFDVKVTNMFAPIRRILGLHSGWTAAMDKIFLLLCDIQILTGFGILLANYLSLRCYISSYHWQINTYLAWFSNLTHAACLSALRGHLYRNKIERNFRMIVMTALVIMLIVAMVPTIYFNWRETSSASAASSNARCFFSSSTAQKLWDDDQPCESRNSLDGCTRRMKQSLGNSHAFQSAVVSIVLLVFNFASRSAKLYRTISDVSRITLREEVARGATFCLHAVSRRCKRRGSSPILIWVVSIFRPLDILIAFYLLAKLYTDWFFSELADVSIMFPHC